MLKKLLKIAVVLVALSIATPVVGFVGIKSYGDSNFWKELDTSAPLNAELGEVTEVTESIEFFGVEFPRAYRKTPFTIEGWPGDRVTCTLTQPLAFEGKLPTILFLHGSGQDKRFVEDICTPFNEAGFAMVSYDQAGRGERRNREQGAWRSITESYNRGWKAVYEARRIADYLVTREDVDPERLYIVGASYGAMVSTHVLAQDKRFDAAILIVGGGDFRVMLDAPLIRDNAPRPLHAALKPIARWLGGPFDPILSAPLTGPTPILMQNGSADMLVSPESGQALYDAIAAPKEIIWYDIDHPGLREGDGPEIIKLLDDGLIWLAEKADITLTAEPVAASLGAQASVTP